MLRRKLLTGAAAAALTANVSFQAFARERKTLIVGMDAAYPPFGFQNSKAGTYVGFDVDVIRAIGKAEGFAVDIRNMAFDGLIPALKTGNIDIAINDITVTPERQKSVDFSDRYYIAGLGVVVAAGNNTIKTAKDLEGGKLAASIGSTGEIAAKAIKGADVRIFNQLNECFLELRNGGVEAVVNDIPTNDYYVANAGRGRVKSLAVALTAEDLAIAVKKGNTDLLARVNRGLRTIKRNGEFAVIYKKWFGKEPPKALFE